MHKTRPLLQILERRSKIYLPTYTIVIYKIHQRAHPQKISPETLKRNSKARRFPARRAALRSRRTAALRSPHPPINALTAPHRRVTISGRRQPARSGESTVARPTWRLTNTSLPRARVALRDESQRQETAEEEDEAGAAAARYRLHCLHGRPRPGQAWRYGVRGADAHQP